MSWQDHEKEHVWHPYASMVNPLPVHGVRSANGVRLHLEDGRTLIDGMASWWAVIHGYNHPVLNRALETQLEEMAHVMFGGLTHRPAAALAKRLIHLSPEPLERIFFADSGSVSVEVALKMAIQYWQARGKPRKSRMLTFRGGYHGDTFGAMSVSDPENGMHHLFANVLTKQFFADVPTCRRDEEWQDDRIAGFKQLIESHRDEIAAVIVEPLVQGAGGMRFYCPEYLRQVRALCDANDVLLIFDEIATGFGRTGTLFATEQAGISPDIMCIGKALTGGYMTLAATLTTREVADGVCAGSPGLFMHGPTFMANPLACAVADASVALLVESPFAKTVARIEGRLRASLAPLDALPHVADVRCKGAIGVVELEQPVDMVWITEQLVERGVWVRPFGRLVYLMPPFVIDDSDLDRLASAVSETVRAIPERQP